MTIIFFQDFDQEAINECQETMRIASCYSVRTPVAPFNNMV